MASQGFSSEKIIRKNIFFSCVSLQSRYLSFMSIDQLAHADSLEMLATFHEAATQAMYEWQDEQAAEYFSSLFEE